MTTILLVRHGETEWNREQRFQGHADPPLNDAGRAQARELAERLAGEPLDAIYTSDLVRAHETARIVAARVGAPVTVARDLREVDVGPWSGLTRDEIRERFADGFARWVEGAQPDGWEPREPFAERVLGAVRRIAQAHPAGRVLVVSHGGVLRAIHRHTGAELRPIGNCALVTIACENGAIRAVD